MPAELFFFFLAGSGLLLWAALRAHSHVKLVAWGLGLAVVALGAGMWLAEVSGLASGEIEPAGLPWLAVTASLAVYVLGIILVGLGGALIGVGGLLLSFLKAGKPILPRETIFRILPELLLLMTAAFVAGFFFS